jgi:glycerophosphoryl diester phosphodiesterase
VRRALAYFASSTPRVIAHRGLSLEVPENTLASFDAAVTIGVTHIETDVHSSLDGVAIVSHDSSLDRVAGREGTIANLTAHQLAAVDLGGGHGFPSLAEALDAFPESFFNIDVKNVGAIEPTVRAIQSTGAVHRVLVSSFSELRRVSTVSRLPGVATSASSSLFAQALLWGKLGLTPLVRRALSRVDAVQVPEHAAGLRITTPRMIELLHNAGVEVHIWTINDPETMRVLLEMGVDGIVTDRADLARTVVREWQS